MSVNIDLHRANKEKLIELTMKVCNTKDREKIIEVLDFFGTTAGEYYFLLNNEHYEDYNSYYHIITVFDKLFPISPTPGNEYPGWQCDVWFKVSEEIKTYRDEYEIHEKFGIDIYEEDEYEEDEDTC